MATPPPDDLGAHALDVHPDAHTAPSAPGSADLDRALAQLHDRLLARTRRSRLLDLPADAPDVLPLAARSLDALDSASRRRTAIPVASSDHQTSRAAAALTPLLVDLDPASLDRRLVAMVRIARDLADDTAGHALYLVFGTLEWSDDDGTVHRAPLLLRSVTLQRAADDDAPPSAQPFFVNATEDEPQLNLAVRDHWHSAHHAELPLPQPGERPLAYLDRLEASLPNNMGAVVHREAWLVALSLDPLLAYRDFDPARHHARQLPNAHLVHALLTPGSHARPTGSIVAASDTLPLIYPANAAQCTVISTAHAGQHVVVDAGPGTGVSHTIANLTGTILAAGKSVLIVSPTTTALDAAHRALDVAGLGHLALQLYGPHADAERVTHALRTRLYRPAHRTPPARLADAVRELLDVGAQLTAYDTALAHADAATGRTVYDLLWDADQSRRHLGPSAGTLDEVRLANAATLSDSARNERVSCLETISAQLATVQSTTTATAGAVTIGHPWAGIANPSLTFMDERALVATLETVVTRAIELATALNLVCRKTGWTTPPTLASIDLLLEGIDSIPSSTELDVPLLLSLRDDPDRRATLQRPAEMLTTDMSDQIADTPAEPAPYTFDTSIAPNVARAVRRLRDRLPVANTVGDARSATYEREELADQLDASATAAHVRLAELYPACHSDHVTTRQLEWVTRAFDAAPIADLAYRHDGLRDASVDEAFTAANEEVATLRAMRDRLAQRLTMTNLPTLSELRRYIAALGSAGALSFLDNTVTTARKAHKALVRDDTKTSTDDALRECQLLASYLDRINRFNAHPAVQRAAGPFASGVDTPFDACARVATWQHMLQSLVPAGNPEAAELAEAIWSAPAEWLAQWHDETGSTHHLHAILTNAIALIGHAEGAVFGLTVSPDEPLLRTAAVLRTEAGSNHEDLDTITQAGFADDSSWSSIDSTVAAAVDASVEAASVELRAVDEDEEEADESIDMAAESVRATLALYDAIMNASMPDEIASWLLSDDQQARFQLLSQLRPQIAAQRRAYGQAMHAFQHGADLDVRVWFGQEVTFDTAPFGDVVRRAERAIATPQRLEEWVAYLRARQAVDTLGLAPLVRVAEAGHFPPARLRDGFEYLRRRAVVDAVLAAHPALAHFDRTAHETLHARYEAIEHDVRMMQRKAVAAATEQRPAESAHEETNIELQLLESMLQHDQLPCRPSELLLHMGSAVRALTPCLLLSAHGVHRWLPHGLTFDYVIVDDAARVTADDAMSAVARGATLIVVGDTHRMGAAADATDLFAAAAAAYGPAQPLRHHYGARHPDVVAAVNRALFDGVLTLDPAPANAPAPGLLIHGVLHAAYDDGHNGAEAARVADLVFDQWRTRPTESLGVVAATDAQAALIAELVEQRVEADPFARFFAAAQRERAEPFFIHTPSRAHGQTRDVLIASMTVARPADGPNDVVRAPLDHPAGRRMVTSMVAGARRQLHVVTSVTTNDLAPYAAGDTGVAALAALIRDAESVDGAPEAVTDTPSTPFQLAVSQALHARGFDAVANVRVAGSVVDLAVRHPQRPEQFILGVLGDGPTILPRADRAQLVRLGWAIAHLWSAEWARAPESCADHLVDHIHAQLAPHEL